MSERKEYAIRRDRFESESIIMDYAVIGSGRKNLVIIPGLSIKKVTPAAGAVAKQYDIFLDEYTVYLFDRNDIISDNLSVWSMADDIARVLGSLNVSSCDVFGASQGGTVAMCLAVLFPDLVRSAVLGSTFAKSSAACAELFSEWIELAREKKEKELVCSFGERVFSPAFWEKFGKFIVFANSDIEDAEYEKFIALTGAVTDFDITGSLKKIKCPVLVIGCEGDRVLSYDPSVQISESIPGAELYTYDSTFGHGVYDEAPDYVKRCYDFFKRAEE